MLVVGSHKEKGGCAKLRDCILADNGFNLNLLLTSHCA